jgi:hypothetical protein
MTPDKPKKSDNRPPQLRKPRGANRNPREMFLARHQKFVQHARRSLRRVVKLGNPRWHNYSPEEGARILKVLRDDMADVERAFKGTPVERGLYDV